MVSSVIDPEFCKLPCKIIMDRNIPTVNATEKLVKVIKRLMEKQGDIIVIEDGTPIGSFNTYDVLQCLTNSEIHREDLQVKDVVCTPVIRVDVTDPIEEAFNVMEKLDIKSLAVTENKKLKGYITGDGVKEFMRVYPHYLRMFQDVKQGKCSEIIQEMFESGSPTK